MSAPTTLKNLFTAGNSNGTTAADIFTHGTGLKNPDGSAGFGGILDRLVIKNDDTVVHGIHIYRVPSGGATDGTTEIELISLAASAVYVLEGPYYSADSAKYRIKLDEAHTTNPVRTQAYYHEMS